ncbi:hypothetical protein GGS23DRAFT_587882, partial [Durotheca rogersii]|uniref:uncharacterized protein n=1 Tax=Durotheca rogersii TaxID=419775 RepID=UPI002220E3DD
MDHPQGSFSHEYLSEAKHASKYFHFDTKSIPRNSNVPFRQYLVAYAKREINSQLRNGVMLTDLWRDAHDSVAGEDSADPQEQYKIIARKLTARMIASNLFETQNKMPSIPFKIPDTDPGVTNLGSGPASTTSTSPLSKLNPEAKTFAPTTHTGKTGDGSGATKATSPYMKSFQERCKRRGLRISSTD